MRKLMNAIVFITVYAVLLIVSSGCGGRFLDTHYADEIQQATDVTVSICETAKVLADAGVDVPGVDQCDTIVEQLTRDEVVVVVAVLNCMNKYEVADKEFAKCAIDAGWDPVKDRINQLRNK